MVSTRTVSLTIPVSPAQEKLIVQHLLKGTDLGMAPDERFWMFSQAQKKHWGCKLLTADLVPSEAVWILALEL